MVRYHLTVTFYNAFFESKLNSRGKINSVEFLDYSLLFQKIIQDMSYSDIYKFKLNIFNWFKDQLSYVRVNQYVDGNFKSGYSIISQNFNVSSHVIACCLPSRKIRDEYFEFDALREKFYIKTDFIFYLK